LALGVFFDILWVMIKFKLPNKKKVTSTRYSSLAKVLIVFSLLLFADLFVTLPMSPLVRGLLIGTSFGALIAGSFVFYQSYKRITKLEDKEDALLSTLEESLETLQNVIEDGHFENGALAELDDDNVLVLPDCAVVVGHANTDSYVIPYITESDETPESRALFSALNIMKENDVRFKVLKPRHGNKLLKRSSKTEWLSAGSSLSLNFPQNFVNLN
jgi:hypothetical protein